MGHKKTSSTSRQLGPGFGSMITLTQEMNSVIPTKPGIRHTSVHGYENSVEGYMGSYDQNVAIRIVCVAGSKQKARDLFMFTDLAFLFSTFFSGV